METKQRIYECGFAGAVGPEQPNGAALQNAGKPVKNRSAAELYFEPIKLNCRSHRLDIITDWPGAKFHVPTRPTGVARLEKLDSGQVACRCSQLRCDLSLHKRT